MPRERMDELKAGIFVVVALCATAGVLVWLGAADVFAKHGQRVFFKVSMDRGNLGVAVGSPLKINDATIGKVNAIRFDPATGQTLYDAILDRKDIAIHADAIAVAESEFVGETSVLIQSLGKASSPLADREHAVGLGDTPSVLLRQMGFGDDQRKQLQEMILDLQKTASTVSGMLAVNRVSVEEMVMNLKSMSANLNAAAKEIRRNPWRLLEKPSDKEIRSQNLYDATRAFSEGAGELDDAVGRLSALRESRPEGIKADDPDLTRLREQLHGSFEKLHAAENKLWEELNK